jgi:ABC-2 type transport system permease protein
LSVAVYERTYHPYEGTLTPERARFLVLPRYAFRDVFQKKLFVGFLATCFVWPLLLAILIYLPHNLNVLKLVTAQTGGGGIGITFNAAFFLRGFMVPQGILSFILAFIIGPALISSDLRNNALPLYFARPFARWEYVLGKALVLVILLSLITWIPGLLLFLLQAYLVGEGWLFENFRIGVAIFLAAWIYIALLCLISLAISAYVKWKPLARLGLFGVFVVAAGLSQILNFALRTDWGSVINLADMMRVVWSSLFGVRFWANVPVVAAWASLLAACGVCLLLLARKIRAYEVIK